MPKRSKVPCAKNGCKSLVERPERYCIDHKAEVKVLAVDNRESASKRGYNRTWRKYRETFLVQNPFCTYCIRDGELIYADVVDHIKPHKGDMKLFWDPENHQGLCTKCHNKKTASEDGGFGNKLNS